MLNSVPDILSPAGFQQQTLCSDRQLEQLSSYVELLQRWQTRINLVSRATLADPWRRHVLDSAQLAPLLPEGSLRVADIGSGAGFPGLVLAVLRPDIELNSIESDGRKSSFQREAARIMGLTNVVFHVKRIEAVSIPPVDVVTARALASLSELLGMALRLLKADGLCLFPKGQQVASELTEARKIWTMREERIPSLSETGATILKLSDLKPV
jgi:16S rRNA (guanine527-N7)-methyltransferase